MTDQVTAYLIIMIMVAMGAVGYFAVGCGIVMALAKVRGVFGTPGQILETILHFGFFWPRYIFGGKDLP